MTSQANEGGKWQVFDIQTREARGTFKNRNAARNKADRLDLEYGAIRYGVRELAHNPANEGQAPSFETTNQMTAPRPKCQIQWIDAEGKPTPDENDAVMIAHIHEMDAIAFRRLNEPVQYTAKIDKSFPICAEHYAKVTARMRYGAGGGWEFTPID